MINTEMARDYLHRAKRCLREATLALEENDPPGVIRRSQEALELATKALLRLLGIEYPRVHDISDVILEQAHRLPDPIKAKAEQLADLISELAAIRGPAFYGYEREGIPPSKAFKMNYAKEIYQQVVHYVRLIEDTIKQHQTA